MQQPCFECWPSLLYCPPPFVFRAELIGLESFSGFALCQQPGQTTIESSFVEYCRLAVAIGMAGGMALMIKSLKNHGAVDFSLTSGRLVHRLQGCRKCQQPKPDGAHNMERSVSHPAVSLAEVGQMFPIQWKGKPTFLTGMPQEDPLQWTYPMWLEKPSEQKSSSERNATFPQAAISESFQSRFDVHLGDRVEIPTPSAATRFRSLEYSLSMAMNAAPWPSADPI